MNTIKENIETYFEFHNTQIQETEVIKSEQELGAHLYLQEAFHDLPTVLLMGLLWGLSNSNTYQKVHFNKLKAEKGSYVLVQTQGMSKI